MAWVVPSHAPVLLALPTSGGRGVQTAFAASTWYEACTLKHAKLYLFAVCVRLISVCVSVELDSDLGLILGMIGIFERHYGPALGLFPDLYCDVGQFQTGRLRVIRVPFSL